MANKNGKTQIKVTAGTLDSTTVRSREPQSLDAVFDKVVAMQEAKKALDADLKVLKEALLDEVKDLGGEYIRNGMKAQVMAENFIPNGKLVTLKEVLVAVPKRYHRLILADKSIAEYVKLMAVKENNVKVTIRN
tara:strand:+ start:719 stop:1120 length:402 start_codon:yes stop_codon:yes gene_type:complete